MDIVTIIVAFVALAVGFAVGRASGGSGAAADAETRARAEARRLEDRFRSLAEKVGRGQLPEGAEAGSPEALLRDALRSRWAPRHEERRAALQEAIGRVSAFLDHQVKTPLAGATAESDAADLRERIVQALGNLQDLEFFLEEPGSEREGQNVSALVQQVTREFAQDQDVLVRLKMSGPVRAEVNAQSFMDAIYLLLHNAARFGDGRAVEVVVQEDGGPVIRIEDQGEGFSEDALARAFDPFYSTAEDGLGLGLPHARRVLESMDGTLELANVPGGGARVEVRLPAR